MSASEKLKAVETQFLFTTATKTGHEWVDAYHTLRSALPQIVAVVEAAEITWNTESPGGGGAYGTREGLAVLAALDEALA